jgi:hypothetical protein
MPPGCEAAGGEGFEMLRRSVLRCQAEGAAAAGEPLPLILVAWSCVHGASALWIDGSLGNQHLLPDAEALAQTISATVVRLIAGGV